MSKCKVILAAITLIISVFAAGCNGSQPASGNMPPETAALNKADGAAAQTNGAVVQHPMKLTVYYASPDALFLVPETRIIEKNDHPAQSAIELLLTNPQNHDLLKVMPAGTQLKHLSVKDHIAYVDFNNKLTKNNGGGSTEELLLVGSIIDTLTEFPEIHRVQILVDGKKIDTISGHMELSEPLSRSEKIIKK